MSRYRQNILISLVLTALTFAVFWRVTSFGFFNYDDPLYVDQNPALKSGLSWEGLKWALNANLTTMDKNAEYWEPVSLVTRLADYQAYGFSPGGHHLTSLLLHLAAGLALFGALQQLTGAVWRSAAVAALFLIHPMHVEPVVWLSARKDVVSGLFYILTIWAYGWNAARPSWPRYALFLATFILTNMAKPMAVSLPLVLLLVDYWPLQKLRMNEPGWLGGIVRLTIQKTPLFLIAVGVSVLAYLVQQHIGAIAADQIESLPWRLGSIVTSGVDYVSKALIPQNLAFFYPLPGKNLNIPLAVCSGVILIALTLVAVGQRLRRPWLTVGWFWFLVVLAPVSGVVQIGELAMADRYSYLALIGLFIAAVWQVGECAERPRDVRFHLSPRAVWTLGAGVIAIYSAVAWFQVQTWQTSESVYRHAIAVTDDNYVAHMNLGSTLIDEKKRMEGMAHHAEAQRIRRDFIEHQLHAVDEAVGRAAYAEAIPRLIRVLLWVPYDADIRYQLGVLLWKNGEDGKALVQFDNALKYRPGWAAPTLRVAEIMIENQLTQKARNILYSVLQSDPDHAEAQALLDSIPSEPAP